MHRVRFTLRGTGLNYSRQPELADSLCVASTRHVSLVGLAREVFPPYVTLPYDVGGHDVLEPAAASLWCAPLKRD